MPKTFTVKQLANALGFSTNTVYKYLDEGKIKATRLGKSGRFKITESEFNKLLGNKPETPTLILKNGKYAQELSLSPELNFNQPHTSLSDEQTTPKLFDWMLALCSVFLGVSITTSPITNYYLHQFPQNSILILLGTLLILGGALTFVESVIQKNHASIISIFSRLLLFSGYLLTSVLFFSANDSWTASFMFTIACFTPLASYLQKKGSEYAISIFAIILFLTTALTFTFFPQNLNIGPFTNYLTTNPILTSIIIIASTAIFGVIQIFTLKNRSKLFLLTNNLLFAFYIGSTVIFITNQQWYKTTITLLVACFVLLVPYTHQIENLSGYTKKRLLISLSWIGMSIVIGIFGIKIHQRYTNTIISQSSESILTSASNYASKYITEANDLLEHSSSNIQTQTNSSTDYETKVKNLFFSTTAFKQITLASSSGSVLATYPPLNPQTTDISTSDYFRQVMNQKTPIVSEVNQLNQKTIYIANPILSTSGEVTQIVIGAIDLNTLKEELETIIQPAFSKLIILNSKNEIILGQENISISDLTSSDSTVFDNSKVLLTKTSMPITELGWTLYLLQTHETAYRQNAYISSLIFFIFTVLGVGSLIIFNRSSTQK